MNAIPEMERWEQLPHPFINRKGRPPASQQNLTAFSKPDGTPNYAAVAADNFYESMVVGLNRLYSVGMIFSSPVIVDDALYFGSMDGNLYAVH